jgi:HD-like signal output (HDOD) protein
MSSVARDVSHDGLSARADAASRVLSLAEDPNAGIADLADAIGTDPMFTSRVIALANSAYYGLSSRVGTLEYGISVLGFQTIRAMAVPIAAGLDSAGTAPAGFWEQAAMAATAANMIAPTVGAKAPDAFCVGLLHTLGSALLHQQHPLPMLCLPYPADTDTSTGDDELNRLELELYQVGHADAAAHVLTAWHFPATVCDLIAAHHSVPLPDATPLTRALHAARALTDLALAEQPDVIRAQCTIQRLTEGKVSQAQIEPLVEQLRVRAAVLLAGILN